MEEHKLKDSNIKISNNTIKDLYEDMCDLFANELNVIIMKEGD